MLNLEPLSTSPPSRIQLTLSALACQLVDLACSAHIATTPTPQQAGWVTFIVLHYVHVQGPSAETTQSRRTRTDGICLFVCASY